MLTSRNFKARGSRPGSTSATSCSTAIHRTGFALSAKVSSRSTSKISNAKKVVMHGSTSATATSTGQQCERPSQRLVTPVASSQNSNPATKHTSATSAVASTVSSSTAHNHCLAQTVLSLKLQID